MPASNLLALIDDIATLLDDIALQSKIAAKHTVGVLGDDLALNAQQVSGVNPDRELPVVWAVMKASFLNKLILVPMALLISAFAPWLIPIMLIVGGSFLCFEGIEKVFHSLFHQKVNEKDQEPQQLSTSNDSSLDLFELEKQKIKGAARTDLILSAEIIVISLGAVQHASLFIQAAVVSGLAAIITFGIYGLVAGIVKLDDLGLYLTKQNANHFPGILKQQLGRSILIIAPWLMKFLSIAGTFAMFIVGGGILFHNTSFLQQQVEPLLEVIARHIPLFSGLFPLLIHLICGVLLGTLVFGLVKTFQFMQVRINKK